MNYKTLILDLDGTLIEYDSYKKNVFGNLKPGVLEFLETMKAKGYTPVIHTARSNDEWFNIRRHLKEQGLDLEEQAIPLICNKPVGIVYIDDRALRFEGSWDGMADMVEAAVEGTVL